jgi:hypothetical protein
VPVLLAVASWFLVQQPVRRGRWIFVKHGAVFGHCRAGVVHIRRRGIGATHCTDGFPTRIGPANLRILAADTDFVNGIGPGYVLTDQVRWLFDQPDYAQKILSKQPTGRIANPRAQSACLPAFFRASLKALVA